jgi:hypothetical protein
LFDLTQHVSIAPQQHGEFPIVSEEEKNQSKMVNKVAENKHRTPQHPSASLLILLRLQRRLQHHFAPAEIKWGKREWQARRSILEAKAPANRRNAALIDEWPYVVCGCPKNCIMMHEKHLRKSWCILPPRARHEKLFL